MANRTYPCNEYTLTKIAYPLFYNPVKFFVFAVFVILLLTVQCKAQVKEPVRGVWITNVDSDVLLSRKNIDEAVEQCSSIGFNTIAVVVWNKGVTLYPSETMQKYFGIRIDSLYEGRDPLQEVIEAAHQKHIRVIAWFEFGFSSSYNRNGGHILDRYPEWKAIDTNGSLVKKNGFEWMNGFHPDVQKFVLQLMQEVVKKYAVDGIQGDDRLPAMPSESGYDTYTTGLYKVLHKGAEPPRNCKDSAWVQWRADLLSVFMKSMHRSLKNINPNIELAMSPSIYPWCKEEYLQDWPRWVKEGWVDLVIPQVYRYGIEDYKKTLHALGGGELSAVQLEKCVPGILLKVGSYYATEELLNKCIEANRQAGYNGEFFFFYEGLKKHPVFFQKLYMRKVH